MMRIWRNVVILKVDDHPGPVKSGLTHPLPVPGAGGDHDSRRVRSLLFLCDHGPSAIPAGGHTGPVEVLEQRDQVTSGDPEDVPEITG